jgi:hypothetical protein
VSRSNPDATLTKVFWFFFSKKNCLPYDLFSMAGGTPHESNLRLIDNTPTGSTIVPWHRPFNVMARSQR